jgi:hypothetical protein
VPTELKIADNWTGPQLFERLEGQLAGDYLRDDASSRGIYLLVYRGVQKHWQLPSGEMASFDELVLALQGHWVSVANAHPGVEEIKVIGIDLTKRAKTPLPKKALDKRMAASTNVAKSTGKGPPGGGVSAKNAIVKKSSVDSTGTKMQRNEMVTKSDSTKMTPCKERIDKTVFIKKKATGMT